MNGNASVDKLRLRSSRAWSALLHANLKTVGDVRRSLENGELQQYRNCGPKTLAEICKAVGFERETARSKLIASYSRQQVPARSLPLIPNCQP
jgi:Bacterial RNA polymerase, alpha chain C terminal domain